ncbi:hypothetical protein FRC01_005938 [Tulasnella sp. 417]|nr:hypothetical protein FRC01_005938 [Tulasnella sp. 417]
MSIADVTVNLLKHLNLAIISENVVDFRIELAYGEETSQLLEALDSIPETTRTLFKSSHPGTSLQTYYDTRLAVGWRSIGRATERLTEGRVSNARQILLVVNHTMPREAIIKLISQIAQVVVYPDDPLILDLPDEVELDDGWNKVCSAHIVGIVLRAPNPIFSMAYLRHRQAIYDHPEPHLPFRCLQILALRDPKRRTPSSRIVSGAAKLISKRSDLIAGHNLIVQYNGHVINDFAVEVHEGQRIDRR